MNKKFDILESHGLDISAVKDAYKYANKYSNVSAERVIYTAYIMDKALKQLKIEKRDKLDRYCVHIEDCIELEQLQAFLNNPYSKIEIKQQGTFTVTTNKESKDFNLPDISNKCMKVIERNVDQIEDAIKILEIREQIIGLDIPGSFRDKVLALSSTKELGSFNYRLDSQLSLIEACMYTLQKRLNTGNYISYVINDLSIIFKAIVTIEDQLGIEVDTEFEDEWNTLRNLHIAWSSRERDVDKYSNVYDLLLTVHAINDKLNRLEEYWLENYSEKRGEYK